MTQHLPDFHRPHEVECGIDRAVLDRVLSIGGPALRAALLDQLSTDLERLRKLLIDGPPEGWRAAAHELKGIAATIGADSLARLAQGLEVWLDGVDPAALWDRGAAVQGELDRRIGALLHILQDEGGAVVAG